jgi:ribokinase
VSRISSLKVDLSNCDYQGLIGTGGIGSGLFFALNGDHTLGREESRSGRFLDHRDYCKLHIILHYSATLLPEPFQTIPIGMVGEDNLGSQLMEEMRLAGMDLSYVEVLPGERTLLSICLLYPDGSGGNLTPEHSASHCVNVDFITGAAKEFSRFRAGHGIALAVPEVPLEARLELLAQAGKHNFLRVGSFTSGELLEPFARTMLAQIDLLSINMDEAAALIGYDVSKMPGEKVAQDCLTQLSSTYPSMQVTITNGCQGSWGWDGERLHFYPALPVQVANTAGAGDAFLAGMIIGRVAGLKFYQAQILATLIASYSTTSPHTIHPNLDRRSLRDIAYLADTPFEEEISRLLEE